MIIVYRSAVIVCYDYGCQINQGNHVQWCFIVAIQEIVEKIVEITILKIER